jgi:hypothetical protein
MSKNCIWRVDCPADSPLILIQISRSHMYHPDMQCLFQEQHSLLTDECPEANLDIDKLGNAAQAQQACKYRQRPCFVLACYSGSWHWAIACLSVLVSADSKMYLHREAYACTWLLKTWHRS